jgi:hypothetical protein
MNRHRRILLTLSIALLIGCNRSEPAHPSSPTPPQATVATPPPPPPPSASQATNPPSPQPPKSPNTTKLEAKVGVGVKGHYGTEGVIVTPIASLFAVRERLAFEVQIPEAMKLFKATEDRFPKSQEEFMERIIKENHIQLPLLPEGSRYFYDPQRGELMVESPTPQ